MLSDSGKLSKVNFRVLGLDPGGTTGWSAYSANLDDDDGKVLEEMLQVGQIGPGEHHEELYDLLDVLAIQNYWIVCESFEYRNSPQAKHRDNINLMSKEYIGVTKLYAQQKGLTNRLKFLTAGQSKKFIPDKAERGIEANAKLKAMGWYKPGQKHGNDATRVVVNHLVNYHRRHDLIQSWRTLV